MPEAFWLSHLDYWQCDEWAQRAALEALLDRFLVEEQVEQEQYRLRQHHLIRSVALDHLNRLEETVNAERG